MISFDNFTAVDGSPVYMQIIMHIKRGIAAGIVQNEDELPSRRVLSSLLGVNPNTVQKAYRLLEEEGLISSHSGAKSFMQLDEDKTNSIKASLLENDIRGMIRSMQQMDISKKEALEFIDLYWR
ncbi:MAG: GntR family transcriptional regulator [Firmicutes bacterium]|nr:GntR family transcriptional regulator [Clostridiales bacterium]MBQ2846217.1 GntR family transcriptional regulator [Bacillota bacterium]